MAQTGNLYPRWKARFITIWVGQAFSLFGSQLVQFALIWWLTETTHSATVLATATLVGLLPQVLLGPLAGPLIDRWNRKTVMMASDSLVALTTLVLVALFATGTAAIWHVYLALFIRAAAGSFHFPSMQASTSLIVPDEQLARIAGLNQMLQGLMGIVAPPVGALLIKVLSMQYILLIDVATAMIAVLTLFLVHIPRPARPDGNGRSALVSLGRDMLAGLRYIRAWAGLLGVIIFAMLLNLVMAPPTSLVPLLVTNHFQGQAEQLAILNSAMGIGVVAGGILLSVWGGFKRRILTSLAGIIIMAVAMLVVGFAPPNAFWLGAAAFFVLGLTIPIVDGPLFALLQSVVVPEMQGRVFTLLLSGAALMTPLSLAVAGPLADRIGVQAMYLIGGIICTLMGTGALFIPALMNIETNHNNPAVSAAPVGLD